MQLLIMLYLFFLEFVIKSTISCCQSQSQDKSLEIYFYYMLEFIVFNIFNGKVQIKNYQKIIREKKKLNSCKNGSELGSYIREIEQFFIYFLL